MISAYMTETVTRVVSGGLNAYNERQASTNADHPAQVIWGTKIVRGVDGAEVVAAGHIVCKVAYTHADSAVIRGRTHAVVSIEEIRTFSRLDGYRVWFA